MLIAITQLFPESSSRSQDVMQKESQLEQFEINTLTIDWVRKTVTCDESRPRLHTFTTQKIREIERSFRQRDVGETDRDIDSRDELKVNLVSIGSDDSDESSR